VGALGLVKNLFFKNKKMRFMGFKVIRFLQGVREHGVA